MWPLKKVEFNNPLEREILSDDDDDFEMMNEIYQVIMAEG